MLSECRGIITSLELLLIFLPVSRWAINHVLTKQFTHSNNKEENSALYQNIHQGCTELFVHKRSFNHLTEIPVRKGFFYHIYPTPFFWKPTLMPEKLRSNHLHNFLWTQLSKIQCWLWSRDNINCINEYIALKSLLIYLKLTSRKVNSLVWTFQPKCQHHERIQTFKTVKAIYSCSVICTESLFFNSLYWSITWLKFSQNLRQLRISARAFPDLNNVQRQTRNGRGRKRQRKWFALIPHHWLKFLDWNPVLQTACLPYYGKPIKWIFKLLQLNMKQNNNSKKRVLSISAVTYAW